MSEPGAPAEHRQRWSAFPTRQQTPNAASGRPDPRGHDTSSLFSYRRPNSPSMCQILEVPTLSRLQNALDEHGRHQCLQKPPSPAPVVPTTWQFASPSPETRAPDTVSVQDVPERFTASSGDNGKEVLHCSVGRRASTNGDRRYHHTHRHTPQPSTSQAGGQPHHCRKVRWPLLPAAALQRPLVGQISTPKHPSWTRTAPALALGHLPGPGEHLFSKGAPR